MRALPVVEPIDDALGLSGADLLGEGDVALEAREQRQHLGSLSCPFLKYNFHSETLSISSRGVTIPHLLDPNPELPET